MVSYLRFFCIAGQMAELWLTPIYGRMQCTLNVPLPGGGTRTVDVRPHYGFPDPFFQLRVGLSDRRPSTPAEFVKHPQTLQVLNGFLGLARPSATTTARG